MYSELLATDSATLHGRLQLYPVETIDQFVQPTELRALELNSPALRVFTDFAEHNPLSVDVYDSVVQAEAQMRKTHVHLKLVLNQHDKLVGLLDDHDVTEDRIMAFTVKGKPREEVAVGDLMRPIATLFALDYEELASATVEHIVHTLRDEGLQHCLVVDHKVHRVRGIVSARDIARRLHIPLNIQNRLSFIDIFNALNS